MRKIAQLLAAGVIAAAVPMSAQAVVTVTSGPYGFAAPAGLTVIDFDAALPAGYTLTGTGYVLQTGDSAQGAAPGISPTMDDTTRYLSVYNNTGTPNGATLYFGGATFTTLSLYWGSIDAFNGIELFNGATSVGTVTSADPNVSTNANGDQVSGVTNRRVNLVSTLAFDRVKFTSGQPAFEIDNVALGVPEAATWMMMIAGFGMMGFAMRRRPRTAVTFG